MIPPTLRAFDDLKTKDDQTVIRSTQSDLFFWVQADAVDASFDAAFAIDATLHEQAPVGILLTRTFDERGFHYHRSRDLTGFEDGTANPKGSKRFEAALIPEGQPGAGGSFVLGQAWVHDLARFSRLSVSEQEAIIGRTKASSIELRGDSRSLDSHVARTDVKVDGVPQKIWRRSAPFGNVTRHGLFFLGFSSYISRFDIQLRRMYGLDPSDPHHHDRLTEFSQPITSSYWFAPSETALTRMGLMP